MTRTSTIAARTRMEAARALLNLAAAGDDAPLHDAIAAYADNSARLGGLLRALNGAAEETPSRAEAARRLWPCGHHSGPRTQRRRAFAVPRTSLRRSCAVVPAAHALARHRILVPRTPRGPDPMARALVVGRRDRRMDVRRDGRPGWRGRTHRIGPSPRPSATRWLSACRGLRHSFFADVDHVSRRTYLLSSWLTDIRDAASPVARRAEWQRLVDALVGRGRSQSRSLL